MKMGGFFYRFIWKKVCDVFSVHSAWALDSLSHQWNRIYELFTHWLISLDDPRRMATAAAHRIHFCDVSTSFCPRSVCIHSTLGLQLLPHSLLHVHSTFQVDFPWYRLSLRNVLSSSTVNDSVLLLPHITCPKYCSSAEQGRFWAWKQTEIKLLKSSRKIQRNKHVCFVLRRDYSESKEAAVWVSSCRRRHGSTEKITVNKRRTTWYKVRQKWINESVSFPLSCVLHFSFMHL